MSHQISTFTDKQSQQLAADVQLGQDIVKAFGAGSGKITAEILDQAFMAWSKSQEKFSREQIANGLGSLLGELIKKDFEFSWKMVEDDLGLEMALVDDHTGSIVFPVNSVYKRVDPKIIVEPFFAPMYKAIKEHVSRQKGK